MRKGLMRKGLASIAVALAGVLTGITAQAESEELNIHNMDFEYNIDTVKGSQSEKPTQVFTSKGKTYIRFPESMNYSSLPDIYVGKGPSGQSPKYHWQRPFVIINGVSNRIKIVNPQTDKTLFKISRARPQADIPVTPSPYVTNEMIEGFFVDAKVGISKLGESSFNNFAAGGALGWDWALPQTRHWLMGFEIGGAYNGQSNETGKYNPDSVTVWNADAMYRISYLFFSGVYLTGKVGAAYMQDRIENRDNQQSFTPKIGANAGFMTDVGISVGVEANYLFGISDVVSASMFGVNLGYHF